MAGLIAGAEIMSGGRIPHPYDTLPGMVSQSNDGDPHGKPPPASIPSRNGLSATLGSRELVRVARRLCGHAGEARDHAQSLARRARGPTAGAALATEPADRHSARLHGSSTSRCKNRLLPSEGSGLPGMVTLGIALGRLGLYAGSPILNTGALRMPGSRRSSGASARAPALITRTTPAPDTDAITSRKTGDATAARIAPHSMG
jgi:hypothetical protein